MLDQSHHGGEVQVDDPLESGEVGVQELCTGRVRAGVVDQQPDFQAVGE
jgi:hypothetical protein